MAGAQLLVGGSRWWVGGGWLISGRVVSGWLVGRQQLVVCEWVLVTWHGKD